MNWLWLIATYILLELFLNIVFYFISTKFKVGENRYLSITKGVLERLFLITGIVFGYPHVIIAFGAIKIGTRFQKNTKISNDYFLIGNFLSLLFAISYAYWVLTFLY